MRSADAAGELRPSDAGEGRPAGQDKLRPADAGVVLINVLVLLGLSTVVVYLMLSLADLSIARSQRFSEAGQALALVRAGELSAVTALRRDMVEAPEVDHAGEPWGLAAQSGVEIAGGAFELEIADAQGLFNLNNLDPPNLQSAQTLLAITQALELGEGTAERIAASIALDGPLARVGDLVERAGIPPGDAAALAALTTALPGATRINVNAAPPELLAVLLQNPGLADALVRARDRAGFLTPESVAAARAILPPGTGYASDLYRLRVTARIGGTVQSVASLVQRRRGADGEAEAAVVERDATTAVPPPPPPS